MLLGQKGESTPELQVLAFVCILREILRIQPTFEVFSAPRETFFYNGFQPNTLCNKECCHMHYSAQRIFILVVALTHVYSPVTLPDSSIVKDMATMTSIDFFTHYVVVSNSFLGQWADSNF